MRACHSLKCEFPSVAASALVPAPQIHPPPHHFHPTVRNEVVASFCEPHKSKEINQDLKLIIIIITSSTKSTKPLSFYETVHPILCPGSILVSFVSSLIRVSSPLSYRAYPNHAESLHQCFSVDNSTGLQLDD